MDEYDDLLARVRALPPTKTIEPAFQAPVAMPAAPKMDEYDALLREVRQPSMVKAQAAVFNGSFSNPAQEAEKRNLSANIKKMLGEDVEPAIIDPVEDKRRIRQAEMDHALRNSDGFRKWVDSDPANAGLVDGKGANDLAAIDQVLNVSKRAGGNILAGLFARTAEAGYTLGALPFKLGEQTLSMAGMPDWMVPTEMGRALLWAARESKKTGDMLAGTRGDEGNIEAGIYSGLQSLGGNIGTMLTGGALGWGAKATTALMSLIQGGQSSLKAFDEGKTASTATLFGAADTVAEYATELPGMKALLATPGLKQGMMAFVKKAAEFGIKEMGGEQVATAWQDFNEWALLHPEKTLDDYMAARKDAAIQTAVATLVGGGGQIAVQQMMVRGQQAQSKAIFDALHAGAENSELLQNVPEKYREFVKKATEDGGIQNVFVPADKFTTYFQGRDIDPAAAAEDLGVQNYLDAVAAGSDVVIPMDSFATMIAGSDHYAGLADDLRLHQGDMTAREAKIAEANREESDKQLEQSIQQLIAEGEKAQGLNAAIDKIVTDVEGQLLGAGVERSAAKTQANIMRGVAILAKRAFPDRDAVQVAEEQWAKYGLKVQRDMPAVLTHLKDVNLEIDPLLDALRGKGPEQDSVVFGESLLEFLRSRGGLAPIGELTDVASYPTPAGKKKLISELGKRLDEAAMAAVEAGYFPGTEDGKATETQLVEAILNELGGTPTYSMNNTDEAAMGKKAAMEMLDKAIKDAGIDLNAVTDNAEVRRLLEKSGQVTGARFDQGEQFKPVDINSPEFKAWFGDSKVVDADGKPLRVYHSGSFDENEDGVFDTSAGAHFGTKAAALDRVVGKAIDDESASADVYEEDGRYYLDDNDWPEAPSNGFPTDADARSWIAGEVNEYFRPEDYAANITSVYLNIKNPKRVADQGANWSDAVAQAKAEGYDGIVYRNKYEDKGKDSYIAFSPTQIKSATSNTGAFSSTDPRILYQAKAYGFDQTATDPFKRWSNNAPLVTSAEAETYEFKTGQKVALEAFHGTGRGDRVGTSFKKSRATSGPMSFFTSSPELASGYAQGKQDTSLTLEDQNYANWFKVKFHGDRSTTDIVRAWYRLDGETKAKIREMAPQLRSDDNNNVIVEEGNTSGNGGYDYNLDVSKRRDYMRQGNPLEAMVEDWLNSGVLYDDETKFMQVLKMAGFPMKLVEYDSPHDSFPFVYKTFIQMQKPLVTGDIPSEVMSALANMAKQDRSRAQAVGADNWDKSTRTPREWFEYLQHPTDGKYAWTSIPDKVTAVFKSLGYDGIIDYSGNGGGHASPVYIPFEENQVKSAIGNKGTFGSTSNILKQDYEDSTRGYIQIGSDRKIRIGLTEAANLSTFLHETGHFYLEMLGDLAETEGVSQEIKDDYARILKFLGVASRAEITTEHHEKFARANEAYLREGKSPAPELQGVFQRFKAWLTQIYRSIEQLDVTLSDEVREVFDRIYASEQEIAAAKDQVGVSPLFLDAAAAGMTDAEFKNYAGEVAQVSDTAKDKLLAKLMREYQRGKEQWWKEELAKVSKDVAAEVDALPVYQAFAALTSGKLPDGTEIKLNRDQLADRYSLDFIQKLPRGLQRIYSATNGMDLDTAAEILGYQSGDDLIKALGEMRPRKELIKAESEKRMAEMHGDMRMDGSIETEAQVALHNDKRADILMVELRALRRRQNDVKPFVQAEKNKATAARSATMHALDGLPSTAAFRAAAAGRIDLTTVRDLNPGQYLLAGRKAAREAAEALARQDAPAAVEAKQRELLNHYLFLEATKAKIEAKKIAEYAKGFEKASRRQSIAKAGKSYLEQIDALLEQFEFKNVTLRTIDRRQSLADFIAEKEAEGESFAIPQNLIDDSSIKNWRTASMMELRGLDDALRNLAHLANHKNKLLRKKAALDFDKIKVELLDSLNGSFKDSTGELVKLNDKTDSMAEKAAALWRKFDAAHIKVEQLVEWMDGGKGNGPWARYFFDLADDAQVREYDLHSAVTQQIQAVADAQSKEWRGSMMDKTAIRLPGIKEPLSRYDLISIALNTGNASNLQRLKDGRGWSDANIKQVLDELTAEDIAFVNGIWNTLESLWPEISSLQERVAGVPPPKVAHQAMTVKNGELTGGYYPLVYDPKVSAVGAKQADATASVQDFMARGYGKAATSTGHTKGRVENFKAPLLLDYEHVLTSHMAKVVKDISHREAIMGLTKILTNPEIKSALIDKLGEARYKLLTTWEQTLISDRADTLHQPLELHNALFRGLRTHTAIVTMGWKISTMLSQFAGFGPSLDLVKGKYLTPAMIQARLHPRSTIEFVAGKSGEMRHRMDTIDRDMKDVLLKTRGEHGIFVAVQRSAFYLTAMADRAVSIPTWLGGYNQALAEGANEEDAVRAGDRAVRLSQGAGGAKDLAAVQRNSELMKLLTMYYTPFSVLYARLRDMGHTTHGPRDLPKLAARALILVILPAVMGELLAGRGPDDDEDKTMWAARKALLYPFATLPVIRDLVNWQIEPALTKLGGGQMHYQPGYKLSPVVQAIEKLGGLPGKVIDGMTGDRPWDDVAWDTLEASGYLFGLPTAQPRITGEYLADLWTGSVSPDDAAQALHDILYRRPAERNPK